MMLIGSRSTTAIEPGWTAAVTTREAADGRIRTGRSTTATAIAAITTSTEASRRIGGLTATASERATSTRIEGMDAAPGGTKAPAAVTKYSQSRFCTRHRRGGFQGFEIRLNAWMFEDSRLSVLQTLQSSSAGLKNHPGLRLV